MNREAPNAGAVYAASLTPLDEALNINHERLSQHVRWLLANGCDGVALMGTTGEANSFSVGERKAAVEAVLDAGIAPDRLIVGTGCCAIPETVELTNHALKCGVHDVLMLPPFYYKEVSDEGIFAAFDQVMQHVGSRLCRIYLYHFPHMSAVPFSDDLVGRLLEAFPVAGMKDSSGDYAHMVRMVRMFPKLKVFTGTERYLLDVLKAGGAGCITATVNVTCRKASRLANAWHGAHATAIQEELTQVRTAIEQFPMIAALKSIMGQQSGDEYWYNMRPPNVPLSAVQAAALHTALRTCTI